MVVVFPTPLTPTTSMTYGLCELGRSQSSLLPVLFSSSRAAISSLRIAFSSLVETYLSRATLSSILSMILSVVSTPTSEVMSTSSRSSSTSSSTFDFPATVFASLSNQLVLVFSNPLSSVSFFFLPNNPNRAILINAIFGAKLRKSGGNAKKKVIFLWVRDGHYGLNGENRLYGRDG